MLQERVDPGTRKQVLMFPITIQPAVWERIKALLARKGEPGAFLRVGVKGGGCSGFEYVFKVDSRRLPSDLSVTHDGAEVVCDEKSAAFLQGAELVFTGNLIGGAFAFQNPNAAQSCGCGTSFTPKTTTR